MPGMLLSCSRALMFASSSQVYLSWEAVAKVPPYRLFTSARVPWSPPWPLQYTAPTGAWKWSYSASTALMKSLVVQVWVSRFRNASAPASLKASRLMAMQWAVMTRGYS